MSGVRSALLGMVLGRALVLGGALALAGVAVSAGAASPAPPMSPAAPAAPAAPASPAEPAAPLAPAAPSRPVPGIVSGDNARAQRPAAVAALEKARARLASLDEVARTISFPSVEMLLEDADRRFSTITNPARDFAFVERQLQMARAYAERLAAGEDPYRDRGLGVSGMVVKAYRDDFDGTLQPYAVYLPRGEAPAGGWPLLVSLHGAYSNHRLNMRRVFGKSNRPGESDEEATRNELPLPDVPMIVVSPFGRGEFMGYQGLGERDVLRVMADVRRAYAVDPDRIYLTGLSMGGEGTWHIGLRHPDLFAAIVPVCGITDSRQWIGAANASLFDPTLLGLTTAQAVAENASNLMVTFFHGDVDPTVKVAQSRAMAERYRQLGWLGKSVRYNELPGVNHFAWVPAYRDASIFKLLDGVKRDPFPRHVIYRTYSLRYNQAYWLRIDGIEHGLAMAAIEGDRDGAQFSVRTENVGAFSLLLDAKHVPADRPITVVAGGATIYQGAPRPVLSFARAGAAWRAVAEPPPVTAMPDHGASGLFSRALARERPHLYVYGTRGPAAATAANRTLARALGDWGHGIRAQFAVKADTEVTPADIANLDLVLVGSARSNAIVQRLAPSLPVEDRADRLVAGPVSLTDADRGYRVACPNPLSPGHNVLVYGADTERGLTAFQRFAKGNAVSWGPESNQDYLVFDGAGKIRASGVFRDRCEIGK